MSRQINQLDKTVLHVVALVLENHQGEILVAKRAKHQDQGGLWEFPGGKVETGELRLQALKREIKEELNYALKSAEPLKCITHKYSDYTVKLDVWYAQDDAAKVFANEGQPLKWVEKSELKNLNMPRADKPIIKALMLQD